jgi:hypothetical protein
MPAESACYVLGGGLAAGRRQVLCAGVFETGSATPERVGSFTATRSFLATLTVQLETTAGTAHARLWNGTTSIAAVSTISPTTARLTVSGIPIVAGTTYTLEISLSGAGSSTDRAIIVYGDIA